MKSLKDFIKKLKVMESLKDFINENFNEFNNLDSSEIIECTLDEFNNEVIDYLKLNYRFDYKGICIYYVKEKNEIWIENFNN
jgi:hypothetical protein